MISQQRFRAAPGKSRGSRRIQRTSLWYSRVLCLSLLTISSRIPRTPSVSSSDRPLSWSSIMARRSTPRLAGSELSPATREVLEPQLVGATSLRPSHRIGSDVSGPSTPHCFRRRLGCEILVHVDCFRKRRIKGELWRVQSTLNHDQPAQGRVDIDPLNVGFRVSDQWRHSASKKLSATCGGRLILEQRPGLEETIQDTFHNLNEIHADHGRAERRFSLPK